MPARRQPQLSYRPELVEIDGLDSDQPRYLAGSRRADQNAKPRELRNGVPLVRPYRYGEPRPRFATEAIRRAEAVYGAPPADDEALRPRLPHTGQCAGCGTPLGQVRRDRRYCSRACKDRARRRRLAAIPPPAA